MVVSCRMKDEAAVWLACGYFVECARKEFVREKYNGSTVICTMYV